MLDTAETVYISSLALLKMLKHGELHATDWLGETPGVRRTYTSSPAAAAQGGPACPSRSWA